jgi:hypothetical protein
MKQGKLTSGENIADLGSSRFKVGALLLPLTSSDFLRGASQEVYAWLSGEI